MHHEGAVSLAWMHARTYYDLLLLLIERKWDTTAWVLELLKVDVLVVRRIWTNSWWDLHKRHIYTSKRLAQDRLFVEVPAWDLNLMLCRSKELRELRKLIREWVAEESLILAFGKLVSKAEHVVVLILIDMWYLVNDVITSFLPPIIHWPSAYANPHAERIERLVFGEVDDVKLNLLFSKFRRVLHWEIEPLVMTFGVGVHSHEEVVLKLFSLDNDIKVSWFEVWVENQLIREV